MRLSLLAAAALVGVAFIAMPQSASAASMAGVSKNLAQQAQSGVPSLVQKVQKKKGRGRGRRAGRRGRGRGRSNAGAAAAGAAIGIIGGLIAAQAAHDRQERIDQCYRHHPRGYFWRHHERFYCDDL